MATVSATWLEMMSRDGVPDPALALMEMALAKALLKDRQYKLGQEMLDQAIHTLCPRNIQSMLNDAYREVLDMETPLYDMFSRASPITTKRTGHTFAF
jgi:hypothetical protein